MSNKVEIPFSKTKTLIPIILLLVIAVSAIVAIISPETFITKTSKYNTPETIRTIAIAAAAIGLGLSIPLAIKWFRNKVGLLIDENGITDFSNATYPELIDWKGITGIKKSKNGPIKSIVLLTNKPEKYINQAKKMMYTSMMKVYKFHGSPLMIVSSRLKISYEELLEIISTEFEKAKGQTPNS